MFFYVLQPNFCIKKLKALFLIGFETHQCSMEFFRCATRSLNIICKKSAIFIILVLFYNQADDAKVLNQISVPLAQKGCQPLTKSVNLFILSTHREESRKLNKCVCRENLIERCCFRQLKMVKLSIFTCGLRNSKMSFGCSMMY